MKFRKEKWKRSWNNISFDDLAYVKIFVEVYDTGENKSNESENKIACINNTFSLPKRIENTIF